MNTGAGKTLVGLMMLKSSMNEGAGPALYLTANNHLLEEVRREAQDLGLPTVTDPTVPAFQKSQAILVCNYFHVFNGRSRFGVLGSHDEFQDVGSIVVDDAHACLESVQDAFTLTIPADHVVHRQLAELFKHDLELQSATQSVQILSNDRASNAVIEIPYWSWQAKQQQVVSILSGHANDDAFKWAWPLIGDCLPLCRVALGSRNLQIAPFCPPVNRLQSFTEARRRIYMTATLADDGVLVTHLDANPDAVTRPITP